MDKNKELTLLNNLDKKYIGEEIKKARKEKKLTREQLACITNIDTKQIYRIENGLNSPKLESFLKIANALGLKIKYFSEFSLSQSNNMTEILNILENSTEKEIKIYLKLIKTIKDCTII